MELTIFIPGLLLPESVQAATVHGLQADAITTLLGRAQRQSATPDWLARAFGLASPLPAGALRKVGAGGTAKGVTGNWLCVDPVHWQVAREGITLSETTLNQTEADALIAALQPLFAEWGSLSASTPEHWELQLSRSLLLETRPLPEAISQPIDPALPAGLDGPAWRCLLAEAQTLLHAHPINRQREAFGHPTINSLWPWGLGNIGTLPGQIQTDFKVVWTHDPMVAGLCNLAETPCLAPPDNFQPASGKVLCHLDTLAGPARNLDALAWREALLALDRDWIAPALAALKRKECQSLRVIGTSLQQPTHTIALSLVRGNLWRFWKRPLPLDTLTNAA